ncbi:MAG: hypothetical protein ACTHN2_14520 [Nitrobacter sp.]|jgi:hypothetical protein
MIIDHDTDGTTACQKPQSGLLAAIAAVLACAAMLMLVVPASAEDGALRTRIASHLDPQSAEIAIFETSDVTTRQGDKIRVTCGTVTVRRDARNFSSSGFAYVIGDDRLWMSSKPEWQKDPDARTVFPGVARVAQYCPGH